MVDEENRASARPERWRNLRFDSRLEPGRFHEIHALFRHFDQDAVVLARLYYLPDFTTWQGAFLVTQVSVKAPSERSAVEAGD